MEGMLEVYCWLLWLASVGGWAAFPQFPLDRFKVLAGRGHSQAIWPQPWHLKHWRELRSLLLVVHSCLSLAPWLFCPWSPLVVVPVPQPADVLWAEAVSPRPVQPSWELGQPGVLLSIPSHGLSVCGYLEHWLGCCPVPPWSGQP